MSELSRVQESSFHVNMGTDLPMVKESITSRVLVDNRLLSITEFTMDAGQALSEHTSTRAAIVTCIEGRIAYSMLGEERDLFAGDVVYMRPDEPHALSATEPSRFALVQVKIDEIDKEIIND